MQTIGRGMLAAAAVVALLHATSAVAWEDYPGFFGPGHAGIVIGDFDGNGKVEAAVSGYTQASFDPAGSQLLAVLAADGSGKLGIQAVSMLPAWLTGSLVPAPRDGQADRLVAVMGEGTASQILILGGVPLRILRNIDTPLVRRVTAIADVDGDGHQDIVAMTGADRWSETYPVVLDYATGAVKWTGAAVVTDVGVAQLDGDVALELIMAGTPGRVVDGATHLVDWTYPAGFGSNILVGRFGTDARVGFATNARWSTPLQIFQAQPYSPVSEIDVGEVGAAAVARLSPGGPDQIAIGSGQWGDVTVYDPRTGLRLVQFNNPQHGVSALAVGDIDGDGQAELVYGAGLTSSGPDLLRAVDLDTLADDYAQNDESGPHSAVSRGDLQGGGSDQVAYLTVSSNSGYAGSNLHVLDAVSGKRLRTRANVLGAWSSEVPHIALAQIDGDAQKEIIVAGAYTYEGTVAALDGVSLEDQWRVGGYDSVFENALVRALTIIDANGDGTPDVVVATSDARLIVLDGRDGAVLWQSVTLTGTTPPSIAAFHTIAGNPQVAISSGAALYVFDLDSRLLAASTKTTAGVTGLWQWGEGGACRLAALDEGAVVTIHHCDTLANDGQRVMPQGTVFFRPLDAQASRFIAASGARLYEVVSDGTAIPLFGALGGQLGADNQGVLRVDPDGSHFDLVIGSDNMVTRKRIGIDMVFADQFE